MCESCVEIDKEVQANLEQMRSTEDLAEIERIGRVIEKLYADRARLHRNPDREALS